MYLITPTDIYDVCTHKEIFFCNVNYKCEQASVVSETILKCLQTSPEQFRLFICSSWLWHLGYISLRQSSQGQSLFTLAQLPFQIKKQVWFLSHSIRQRSQIRSEGSPALRTKSRKQTTALSTTTTKVGGKKSYKLLQK